MSQRLADYRVFLSQFFRTFHSTGAVLPSGRLLGRALAKHIRQGRGPRRILEVGPGTGAVTRWIVDALDSSDTLDLVELNPAFVRRLEERFAGDPLFTPAAGQTRILHRPIEDLDGVRTYDAIVSGLPLNNFSVESVVGILQTLLRLLKPGGTLSFFEYVGVRPLRSLVCGKAERQRLHGVGQSIADAKQGRTIGRDLVVPNVPPAWVHHLRAAANEDGLRTDAHTPVAPGRGR